VVSLRRIDATCRLVRRDTIPTECRTIEIAVTERQLIRVEQALTQLDELTKEFGGSVECESLVVSGRPADAIALIADQRRAGVIAMGLASSQGR